MFITERKRPNGERVIAQSVLTEVGVSMRVQTQNRVRTRIVRHNISSADLEVNDVDGLELGNACLSAEVNFEITGYRWTTCVCSTDL